MVLPALEKSLPVIHSSLSFLLNLNSYSSLTNDLQCTLIQLQLPDSQEQNLLYGCYLGLEEGF